MNRPELLLIGTGHSESERYYNSNALLCTASGNLLIDCGHTIKPALAGVGMSLPDVDGVYISHVHGDHVFGLERIGFESRYRYHKRVALHLEPDIKHLLWDQCLKGSMGYSSNGENRLEDFFEVLPIQDHRFAFGDCVLRTFPTPHTAGKPSYGVIINERVVFTADTNVIPWLASSNYELIIHDCTLQPGNPAHATLDELRAHYPAALRRRMLLIHCDDQVDEIREQLKDEFLGVAVQGQVIPL